ncbi:hypothetical protein D3C74_385270 [compost metagenome]
MQHADHGIGEIRQARRQGLGENNPPQRLGRSHAYRMGSLHLPAVHRQQTRADYLRHIGACRNREGNVGKADHRNGYRPETPAEMRRQPVNDHRQSEIDQQQMGKHRRPADKGDIPGGERMQERHLVNPDERNSDSNDETGTYRNKRNIQRRWDCTENLHKCCPYK